eukprot:7214355-Lingulodinium_polyedra.AAC.1
MSYLCPEVAMPPMWQKGAGWRIDKGWDEAATVLTDGGQSINCVWWFDKNHVEFRSCLTAKLRAWRAKRGPEPVVAASAPLADAEPAPAVAGCLTNGSSGDSPSAASGL